MPKLYTSVANKSSSTTFKGMDVSDVITLVELFSDTDLLPRGFFKGRVLIENLTTV